MFTFCVILLFWEALPHKKASILNTPYSINILWHEYHNVTNLDLVTFKTDSDSDKKASSIEFEGKIYQSLIFEKKQQRKVQTELLMFTTETYDRYVYETYHSVCKIDIVNKQRKMNVLSHFILLCACLPRTIDCNWGKYHYLQPFICLLFLVAPLHIRIIQISWSNYFSPSY